MPNEIYHRSHWGNANAEGFGDVYFDASATNKLYKHSDNYENSDGTDKILRDIPNKASIVLTPTAYSDGSLNTVIPPYQVLPTELVTNGDFSDGTTAWVKGLAPSATQEVVNGALVMYAGSASDANNALSRTDIPQGYNGRKYKLELNRSSFVNGDIGYLRLDGVYDASNIISFGAGTSTIYFTAYRDFTHIRFYAGSAEAGYTIDNVSLKEIQEADFDFSRGSSATRVNEQGLVEDVQILSGELVQNGNFEQIGSELVTNGDFSDGLNNWSSINAVLTIGGVRIQSNGSSGSYISQSGVLTSGKAYKLTFEVKDVQQSGSLRVGFANFGSVSISDIGTQTIYFVSGGANLEIVRNSAINVVIDNVSVKEVGQNWSFGTGWSIGDGVALFDSSGNAGYLTQSNVLEINKKYKLTATVNSGLVSLVGAFYDIIQGQQIQTGVDSIFTVKSANASLLRLYSHPNNGDAEITDIKVVEITDDTDLPRIDFTDGTGSLLLEPQRTNSLPYSEDFTTYNDNDLSIESNTQETLSPQGIYNATKFTATGTDPYIFKSGINVTANTQTASIYVKGVGDSIGKEGRILFWYIGTAGGSSTSITFTLTSDWQRVEGSSTPTSSGTLAIRVDLPNTAVVGDESYVYGFQMEEGSYATSYIPTSGSTVTRSADVANNSGNADLFNDSEGVLYAEIAALDDTVTANHSISISDGSFANTMYIYFSSGDSKYGFAVFSGSSLVCNIKSDTVSFSQNAKIAAKFKQDDFALYLNGTQVATDTSGNTPSGLSSLQFDRGDGQTNFYGKTKCVAVFKEALTDEQLQKLTS